VSCFRRSAPLLYIPILRLGSSLNVRSFLPAKQDRPAVLQRQTPTRTCPQAFLTTTCFLRPSSYTHCVTYILHALIDKFNAKVTCALLRRPCIFAWTPTLLNIHHTHVRARACMLTCHLYAYYACIYGYKYEYVYEHECTYVHMCTHAHSQHRVRFYMV
jgi:hypothetical protein